MALINRLRNALQRLHWQLTIRYTLVTVATLLVVELLAFGAIFLFFSSDTLPRQLQDSVAQALVPRVRPYMSQEPLGRDALQGALAQLARGQIEPLGESDDGSALQINLTNTSEESSILAIDTSGVIVAAVPDASLAGRRLSDTYPAAAGPAERSLSGADEKLFARLSGDRLALSAPVTAADGRTVGAILFIDQFPTEVASFVRAVLPFILGSALVLTAGAALIGTLFGFFTARRLTARFQNLTGAAQAWSLGDFTTRIQDSSHDEIGQLARALNRMSEQLENLLETRKELTRLETRNRLARELHDSVKQQVFATAMQIGAAQALIEQDSRQTKEHLANARQLVTQAQQELKTLIHEMRPAALEGKGLAPALEQYADGWSRQHDIALEMHVRGQRQTPLPIEQALFRVVQEALANVARHSAADVVHIALVWDGAQCILRLRDDGAGFLVDHVGGEGFGLQSMRQRLAALNGSLHVASKPGAGTTVTATVPLNV